jgi:hypothetical protein
MGQEASLPADGEDDLEELAPPSHTTAAATPSSSSSMHHPGQHQQHGGGGKTTASKVPQKMLNMMRAFEQTARGDDSLQKMDSTEGGAGIIPATGGTAATTTTTTKSSLFRPTATARGVISQMRSLRINKQSVEKPKAEQVQDWEKQWYADDEDDSDEEDDVVAASPGGYHNAASSSVPPVGGGTSSAGVVVTPTNAAMARPGLDSGPAIMMSSSHVHLVTPPDLLASGRAAPSSQMLAYSEVSLNHHQQQQHVHMQPDEVFTGVLDPSGKKPDVAMFLPMLRVLGKGSFGKVRTKHERLHLLSTKCFVS